VGVYSVDNTKEVYMGKKKEPVVIKAEAEKLDERGRTIKTQVAIDKNKANDTLLFTLFVLYRLNFLTRMNLKQVFELLKTNDVDDITEYLLKEAARA